jgi:hypothetical protein
MAMEKDGSIQGRWRGAGYGALIGGIVGFGLSQGVRQYHLADVGAFTAVGAAFGASPKGAGIGLGVGAFLGSLSWMVYPKITVGDAVAISLAGLAAGGLAGWVLGAEKEPTDFPPLIPFQIRF